MNEILSKLYKWVSEAEGRGTILEDAERCCLVYRPQTYDLVYRMDEGITDSHSVLAIFVAVVHYNWASSVHGVPIGPEFVTCGLCRVRMPDAF